MEVPTSVSVLFSTPKFIDLSTDAFYQSNIPVLVQKLKSALTKLDRFELLGKSTPAIKSFHKMAGKTFTYLAWIHNDDYLGTTLKYLFSSSGILIADDSMFHSPPPPTSSDPLQGVVDVNQGFWQETASKAAGEGEEGEVEAENDGLRLCSVLVVVVSKVFLASDNKKIFAQIQYAEQHHKPIVLIVKDMPQFTFAPDDARLGHLHKHPVFHFSTAELQFLANNEETYDNFKRVVYVIELLYKEHVLAEKVRQIEAAKKKQQAEEAKKLEEAQKLEEARKRRYRAVVV